MALFIRGLCMLCRKQLSKRILNSFLNDNSTKSHDERHILRSMAKWMTTLFAVHKWNFPWFTSEARHTVLSLWCAITRWLSIENWKQPQNLPPTLSPLFNFVVDQIERFTGWFSHSLSSILLNFQPLDKQSLGFDVCRCCFVLSAFLLCDENEESTMTGDFSCEQLDEWSSFWIHLRQSRALFELNRVDNPFYGSSIFFAWHSGAQIPFKSILHTRTPKHRNQRGPHKLCLLFVVNKHLNWIFIKGCMWFEAFATFVHISIINKNSQLAHTHAHRNIRHLIYGKEIELIGLKIRPARYHS